MELQAQSSLNLQVTKEDLIDILIDEQLTMLEKKQTELNAELVSLQNKNKIIMDKKRAVLETKLRKLCPIPAKKDDFTLSYNINYNNSNISFCFKDFKIGMNEQVCTKIKYSPAEEKAMADNNEEINKVIQLLQTLKNDIHLLSGNNKRVKAKMLRTFLTGTKEGKSILATLDTTPKQALVGYGR